jgi:hypothetical protein
MQLEMIAPAPPTARGGISTVLRSFGERTDTPLDRPAPARSQTADTMSSAGEQVRTARPAYGATATALRTDAETRGTLLDVLA